MDKIIVGTATWAELFAKHDFFHKYRYYLQITASTDDPILQIKWCVTSFIGRHPHTALLGQEQLNLEYDSLS